VTRSVTRPPMCGHACCGATFVVAAFAGGLSPCENRNQCGETLLLR
jgi:hypothetical protein